MQCRFTLVSLVMFTALIAAGCSPSSNRAVSLDIWQKDLDKFATQHANNDMSFLRDGDASAVYPQFAVLGNPSPEKSTDAIGLFLGRTLIDKTDWLVFLLAKVRNQRIEDIRIAMRSDEAGRDVWIVGDSDSRSLQWYREHRESQWRRQHGDSRPMSGLARQFPAEDDVFTLRTSRQSVEVRHEKSGAMWSLPISDRLQRRLHDEADRRDAVETRGR